MRSIGERLLVSLLCVLLGAAVYYTASAGMLLALSAAAAVHELSHLAAMLLLGCRPSAFRLEPSGFCIEYRGNEDGLSAFLIALSGPLGGVLAAAAGQILFLHSGCEWPGLFSRLSLLLSAFNLLPILPLDGGRLFQLLCIRALGRERGLRFSARSSRSFAVMTLVAGVWCLLRSAGSAPLLAAIWLLCMQFESRPLAKGTQMG